MEEAIVDETELDLGIEARFQPGKTYAKAISDYKPQREDELALNRGEFIEIITKFADSWWEGRSLVSGRVGMFPSTFTQLCDPQKENPQSSNNSEDEVEESVDDESDENEEEQEEEEEEDSCDGSEVSDSGSDEDEDSEDDDEDEESESESEEEEEEKPRPKSNPLISSPPKSSNSAPATRITTPKKATPRTLDLGAHSPLSRQRSASSSNGNAGSTIPQKDKERAKSAGENKPAQIEWAKPAEAPKRNAAEVTPAKKKKKSKSKASVEPVGFLATLEGADIRKYRDTLATKEIEIQKLRKEVKTLTVLQKRQDRAIKTLDTEKGEMPRLLQGMHDELRVLREKIREYQARHGGDEKLMQTQHEEILKLKKQMEDQQKLLKSKGVDATTVNQKVKNIIEEKEKMINDLQHKANILSRAKEMEEKKYRAQLKEYQSEIDKLTGEMDKLKVVLKEHGLNRIVRDVEKSPSPTRGRSKSKGTPSSSPTKKKDKPTKQSKEGSSKKKQEKVQEPPVLPKRTEQSMPVSVNSSHVVPQQAVSVQQPLPVPFQQVPNQPNYGQSNQPAAGPILEPIQPTGNLPALPNRSTMQPMFNMGSSSFNLHRPDSSSALEHSPRDELSYRKKSPKNLVNPFSKLAEPSPSVIVPPVTVVSTVALASNPVAQRTTIFGGASNPSNPIYGTSSNLFNTSTSNAPSGSSFGWKGTSTTTTTSTNPAPAFLPATTSPPTGTGNTGHTPSFTQPQESAGPSRPLFLGGGTQPAAESKPSWMFGPTPTSITQEVSPDVFKPNFGFNKKKDKDKWKLSS